MSAKNPFKPGTASYNDFAIMSDLEWHCTKCELESAQAKTWQVWRQKGLQLATNENGEFLRRIRCINCKKTTVHRKLRSLEISADTTIRSNIPTKLAQRIKSIYKREEAVLLRQLPANQLEIDHRFPQVRWSEDERPNNINMSEAEIKDKFILLTRSNNQLKSRNCERCSQTGKRGYFSGIRFWYKGNENWDPEINTDDERGCEGVSGIIHILGGKH